MFNERKEGLKEILAEMEERADYVESHQTWPECSPTIDPYRDVYDWIERIKKTPEYRGFHPDEDKGDW